MAGQERQLTHIVFDLASGRIEAAANFVAVLGVDIGGCSCETLLGRLQEQLSISERAGVDAAREAFLGGSACGEGALSIIGDDGIARHLEYFWSVVRDATGQPMHLFASAIDVGTAGRLQQTLQDLEARHASALRAGRMGSWETDLDAGTRHWSAEGMSLFGLSLPAGQGQVGGPRDEYLNALHPEDRHLVARYYALADKQDSFAAEYRIVRPDGTTMWLSGRGLVLSRHADGRAERLVSIMADVTERRAVEEDLRMERQRLALALDAGRMGAFDLDIDRDRLWWSPQMYEIFGVEPRTFVPTRESVAKLVHPDDFQKFARRRAESIEQKRPFEIEARIIRPDGELAWVAHRGRSTYDASGKPLRSFGVTMDITDRKQREQSLHDADRMKDNFIATLAHELRNPLAPIRNAITLLRRNPGTDDARSVRNRDVIFRQVAQMSRLLDDLLDVSRVSRGQVDLQSTRIELQALFDQAIEIAQPSIDEGRHKLQVVVPAERLEVVGDPLRLAQVLSNLLINAAKYTPPGGRILLSGALEGDELVVRVLDDGIGIDADQMPRIFEMFGRAGGVRQRSQGGLGIGLALARGLVELHGGRIEASSEGPDKGSTFTVRLPSGANGARIPPVVAHAHASESATGAALRILVADDLRDTAQTLAELMESMGHEVRLAHDGQQALEMAAQFLPGVALLDLGMPGMDGYAVARAIRWHDWGQKMTLICQTGWGQAEDRRRSREAGFDHHLVKPLDIDEVASLLVRR